MGGLGFPSKKERDCGINRKNGREIHGALEGRSGKKQSEDEPLFTHKLRRGSCFNKGIV